MTPVNVYIEIDNKAPKRQLRAYGYVLECEIGGELKTRSSCALVDDTYHAVMLKALEASLARIRKPCEITVYGPDAWVLGMLTQQVKKWAKDNFRTGSGDPIAHQKQWIHIWCLMEHMGITTKAGPHAYSKWLKDEMRKSISIQNSSE